MLKAALASKRKRCMIGTGAMTDPYLPIEADLQYMRRCLEVIDRAGFGVAVLTKSNLLLRDLDLLRSIHARPRCVVQTTLTTFDESLCRILEPNVSTTRERFEMLKVMRDVGIPTVVWLCPILPYINDTEENLRGILDYCIEARVHGIINFGFGVTLRNGNREYFYSRLDEHFPGLSERYRQKYGTAYVCNSDNHPRLAYLFENTCRAHNILTGPERLFSYLREFPDQQDEQPSLF